MRINHITIRVKDLEKSIKFYEKITKLSISRRIELENTRLAFLRNKEGETEIELLQVKNDQTFSGKGMFICFICNDLEKMREISIDKNLNPSPIQEPGDGSRYFYVYDPDGVSIQLKELP